MAEELKGLTLAFCKESYDYLMAEETEVGPEIEKAVARGESPEKIYKDTLKTVGEHRRPIALRCKNAARYVAHQQAQAAR